MLQKASPSHQNQPCQNQLGETMSVQTHGSVRYIDQAPGLDPSGRAPETGEAEEAESSSESDPTVLFDTEDHALARYGVVLRRRAGDDGGWRLLVLEGDGAWETTMPLLKTAPERIPAALLRLLEGVSAGSELSAVPAPSELPEEPGPALETGAELLTRMIAQLTGELVRWDLKVRLDVPDAVHQMRVTARSLRSVLKAGKRFFDDDVVAEIESWLRELGRSLSEARDAEVALEMLPDRLEACGDAVGTAFADRELAEAEAHLRTTSAAARRHVGRSEHIAGLARVRSFAADLPLSEKAGKLSARKTANKLLKRSLKKTRKAAARSAEFERTGEAADTASRLVHLHSVRKAAKRVRYVAAAVDRAGVVPGARVRSAGEEAKRVQKSLGETMDAMVLETWLRRRAVKLHGSRADHYALGMLHGAEMERVRAGVEQGADVIRELLPDSGQDQN